MAPYAGSPERPCFGFWFENNSSYPLTRYFGCDNDDNLSHLNTEHETFLNTMAHFTMSLRYQVHWQAVTEASSQCS